MKFSDKMINISVNHPKKSVLISVLITLVFLTAFPFLKTDTDPVHMLPQDNEAVVMYNQIKKEFHINDMVGFAIERKDGKSLFTALDVDKIDEVTRKILEIKDADGSDIFVKADVVSLSTLDDIIKNKNGELLVTPLMDKLPETDEEAQQLLVTLNDNPLVGGKISSTDGTMVAVVIPIVNGKKDRSYFLNQKIEKIINTHLDDQYNYYVGGLPMAESTFGNEMFVQMAVYAPMAGVVIMILLFIFFRNVKLTIAPMAIGMMAVVWSMGALIFSGNVVHIMSSMIPIFILPIAVLDSIHVLSTLHDEIKKHPTKKEAVVYTMKELFSPMLFTSITTMVGFASLSTTGIPPVVVFGVTVAFGVFVSWLLTILLLPAFVMLMSDKSLETFGGSSNKRTITDRIVSKFHKLSWRFPKVILFVAAIIMVLSYVGVQKIIINDNPVRWFKKDHPLRIADVAMNKKVAGTYLANLYFSVGDSEKVAVVESDEDDFADEFSDEDEAESNAQLSIKDPRVINYMAKVSDYLKTIKDGQGESIVGGTTSVVDLLRKVGKVAFGSDKLPDSREKISQYMFLFESGDIKKGKDMWKLISPNESRTAQMWIYLNSGDNQNMVTIEDSLEEFVKENPAPILIDENGKEVSLKLTWSGLTHINRVWQEEMVAGMVKALLGSFVIVFFMMLFLFKSPKWAIIAMMPLTITILFIYGLIGFTGKFYDMPIAILSSLTLGLSIDFAIHFIEHARQYNAKYKDFKKSFDKMFHGTAQAIWRNVLVISVGFAPLFFAGLVPYVTVGMFFFLIMLASGVSTLLLMPAVLKLFHRYLPSFKEHI